MESEAPLLQRHVFERIKVNPVALLSEESVGGSWDGGEEGDDRHVAPGYRVGLVALGGWGIELWERPRRGGLCRYTDVQCKYVQREDAQ